MKYEEELRWAACRGKKRFDCRPVAWNAARRMRRRRSTPVTSYYCRWCGGWHVGRRSRRRGEKNRLIEKITLRELTVG